MQKCLATIWSHVVEIGPCDWHTLGCDVVRMHIRIRFHVERLRVDHRYETAWFFKNVTLPIIKGHKLLCAGTPLSAIGMVQACRRKMLHYAPCLMMQPVMAKDQMIAKSRGRGRGLWPFSVRWWWIHDVSSCQEERKCFCTIFVSRWLRLWLCVTV
jgi:hypothetical protein